MKTTLILLSLYLLIAGSTSAQDLRGAQPTNTSSVQEAPAPPAPKKKVSSKIKRERRRAERDAKNKIVQQIKFDFTDKKIMSSFPVDIEEGQYFQIIIDNINQNLYKISLTKTDSVLSKRQETPAFGAFNLDALSKLVAGISPLSTSLSIAEMGEQFVAVQKGTAAIDNRKEKKKAPSLESKIESVIKKEEGTLAQYKTDIEDLARLIDELKLKVYKKRLNSYKSDNPSDPIDYDDALKQIEARRAEIISLNKKIIASKSAYATTSESLKIPTYPTFAATDKNIKELYDKFIITLTTIESSINAEKANELLSPLVLIENNKNNTFTSFPIQFMGEQTRVLLSITPRDEKFNLNTYILPMTFPTKIKKYTSAGISFYGASIYDRAYSITEKPKTDTTTVYTFEKDDEVDKSELGLAAMLRYGRKLNYKNNFGIHGSIGAGISMTNKIKPRAFFGGGVSLGKKHMLALDAGLIAGYVDKHSNTIDTEIEYKKVPSNLTVARISYGVFGSIGYLYQF